MTTAATCCPFPNTRYERASGVALSVACADPAQAAEAWRALGFTLAQTQSSVIRAGRAAESELDEPPDPREPSSTLSWAECPITELFGLLRIIYEAPATAAHRWRAWFPERPLAQPAA